MQEVSNQTTCYLITIKVKIKNSSGMLTSVVKILNKGILLELGKYTKGVKVKGEKLICSFPAGTLSLNLHSKSTKPAENSLQTLEL